jgi:hypothetical protein
LKGPAKFQEMTPAMCGKNGDHSFEIVYFGALIEEVRFAVDSPLEGAGFEPSVPPG